MDYSNTKQRRRSATVERTLLEIVTEKAHALDVQLMLANEEIHALRSQLRVLEADMEELASAIPIARRLGEQARELMAERSDRIDDELAAVSRH